MTSALRTTSLRTTIWIAGIVVLLALLAGGVAIAANGDRDRAAGQRIPASAIAADTRVGAVELRVRDLDLMVDYYGTGGVGLDVLERADGTATLGRADEALVRLEQVDAAAPAQRDAGLFHTAIRFDDAPALARSLVGVAGGYPGLYGGSADHAVSLAFYFTDPEGNGVELYVDTPRDGWVWRDGQVQMGSAPLDIQAFVREHLDGATDGGATAGHVHLKVGDLARAESFYADQLGFAVTARADGAIFLAAGGYHHHLAANTWASAGAGQRGASLGLGSIEVVVPDAAELDAVSARLTDAGTAFERTPAALVTTDPWGTVVELTAAH